MEILCVHNYYQQLGGEDQVFIDEANLLELHNNQVIRWAVHNDDVKNMHPISLAQASIWNGEIHRKLRDFLRQRRPQIAHFHNTLPLISPSAYYAAKSENIPVVQTLHNYRLLCPNALFFRDGQVCEDCVGTKTRWPSIVHKCYRNSRLASATVATMLGIHQIFNTWSDKVDLYVALTEFARRKFVENGLPEEKIVVKPNFVAHDSGPGSGSGGYGLFVGRLSVEKGLDVLIKAWELLGSSVPLKIVGDGPLKDLVIEASKNNSGIQWLGQKPLHEVYSLMGEASFVVISSKWYETFGRVAIEAFAKGTPVIASKIGALEEIVDCERTGLHFNPSDSEDLAEKVEKAFSLSKSFSRMRHEARAEFESKYTADKNYEKMMEIYEIASKKFS